MRWLALMALVAACGGREDEYLCRRLSGWNPGRYQGDCQNQLSNGFTADGCQAGLAACSDTDFRGLTSYTDCMESLPVCARSTESVFLGEMLGCQNILTMRVRSQCVNGL